MDTCSILLNKGIYPFISGQSISKANTNVINPLPLWKKVNSFMAKLIHNLCALSKVVSFWFFGAKKYATLEHLNKNIYKIHSVNIFPQFTLMFI